MLDARSPTWTSESRSPHARHTTHELAFPSRVWPPIRSPIHTPSTSLSVNSHLSSHPTRRTSPASSSPISAPSIAHPTVSWSRGSYSPIGPSPSPLDHDMACPAADPPDPGSRERQCPACGNVAMAAMQSWRAPRRSCCVCFWRGFSWLVGPGSACQPTGAGNCAFWLGDVQKMKSPTAL